MKPPDGHVRLCAGCHRSYYLDWVPEVVADPPPFFCIKCAGPRPVYEPPVIEVSDEVWQRIQSNAGHDDPSLLSDPDVRMTP